METMKYVSAAEIRAEFARRLVRRFEGMDAEPGTTRFLAVDLCVRIVELLLAECEDADG